MEEHLRGLLLTLNVPVGWSEIPQRTPLPFIVLVKVDGLDEVTLDGRSEFLQGRVQVDCYGRTFAQAVGLARGVTRLFSGYRGGPIWFARQLSVRDLTEAAGGDTIQRQSLDFSVLWTE